MIPRREGGDVRPLSLAALAHVVIFAGVFRELYTLVYSGTGRFYHYASQLAAGKLPYRDYPLEYPPFALAFFGLPRLVARAFAGYQLAFYAEVLLADLAILATLWLVARRRRLGAGKTLALYTGIVLAIGPVMLHQYDVFPALLTLLAVVCFADGRTLVAAALLALATMTKVYPLLLAPVFMILEWRAGRLRDAWRAVAVFTAVCVTTLVPWLIAAPSSLVSLYSYHANRGVQIESTYAAIAFIAHRFGVAPMRSELGAGSFNLAGPFPDALARISGIVLLSILILAYVFVIRRTRRASATPGLAVAGSLLVLICAVVGSKVLSPQYLIWLAPLLPLLPARRGAACALFMCAGVLTYYVYPSHYAELLAAQPLPVAMLVLRNALLIVLAAVVADAVRMVTRDGAAA